MRVRHDTWVSRSLLLGTLVALALVISLITAPSAGALYLDDTVIPGKPLTEGSVDGLSAARPSAVHRIYLQEGQEAAFSMQGDAGTDFDLYLYPPDAEDFSGPPIAGSFTVATSNEDFEYDVPTSGWYYLRVRRMTGADGTYSIFGRAEWPIPRHGVEPERLWGGDRYSTAVGIASETFPEWKNVDHVIIASGEDRAAADPLSAAGLAWAYGAPVFLVQSDATPASVIHALRLIREENGPFYLHIVGGPVSVGPGALADIEANVTGVIYDRLAPAGNRYQLAATIARRMNQERPRDTFMLPWIGSGAAYIANGEDPEKFFDALALSPVCATTGWPILLVGEDHIPAETRQALADLNLRFRVIGGGPATVSERVEAELDAGDPRCTRVWGDDRYETAEAIMSSAAEGIPPIVTPGATGVVAKLPDALTGGTFLGLRRGCLLLTQDSRLPSVTRRFIQDNRHDVGEAWVLGGPVSVEAGPVDAVEDALGP